MRHQHDSIRLRASVLGVVAAIAAAVLVYAYVTGRPTVTWWLLLGGSLFGAIHYHRRSRK